MQNDPIATLLDNLESSESETIPFEYVAGWPTGVLEVLVNERILDEPGTRTSVVCHACENEHGTSVYYHYDADGIPTRAYHECGNNDDVGEVKLTWEELQCWPLRIDGLVSVLAREMSINSKASTEGNDDRVWYLGEATIGVRKVRTFLIRGVSWTDAKARFAKLPNGCAALTLGTSIADCFPSTVVSVSLATVLRIDSGGVQLDVGDLAAAVDSHRITYDQPATGDGSFGHSADFRSVRLCDVEYPLPPNAAQVVENLWREASNCTPDLSLAYIFEEVLRLEGKNPNIKDTFQDVPGWRKLIVSGKTRGTIRLNLPDF